jgi:hypothetical protein
MHALHRGKIDQKRVIGDAMSGGAVTSSANCRRQAMPPGEIHRCQHVRSAGASGDGGPAVDHGIVDGACGIVSVGVGTHEPAGHLPLQFLESIRNRC